MQFGWINVIGATIIALMLIPNIVYAIRNKDEQNYCTNRAMNVTEQTGRYACIILMWFPLGVWEFRFASVIEMLIYLLGNAALLSIYWIVFMKYLRKRTKKRALILAVVPACIFLLSGLVLRHWLLVGLAFLFGISHIYVTQKNIR